MPSARSAGQLGRQDKRAARLEIVPVDPLRDRYLMLESAGLMTAGRVAHRMTEHGHKGFMRKATPKMLKRNPNRLIHPDTTRVKRVLGIVAAPQNKHDKTGKRYEARKARYIDYEYAVTLADFLGMTPVDAGV